MGSLISTAKKILNSVVKAAPEKPNKHDVMISYNWGSKTTVLKIREQLKKNGISCWIDVEDMSVSMNDAMSAAVENCTIFLMCYSRAYSESRNCKKKAEYAEQRKKIIIPCKMEADFEPKEWLGFLKSGRLYVDFSGTTTFGTAMELLLKLINENIDEKQADRRGRIEKKVDPRKMKEFPLHDVEGVRHIAHCPPDKFWIGYEKTIALIDSKGKKVTEFQRYRFTFGAHSVTKEGHLVYLSGVSVKRYLSKSSSEVFIRRTNIDDWKARSIYASHRTGDVIVGFRNERKNTGKLAVYYKNGEYKQTIENDTENKPIYTWPRYITDNVNGDIVTSDWHDGIIVTNQDGRYRFTYTYNLPLPRAVVTDSNGDIFVCNGTPKIHVLNQNGTFLMDIFTGSRDVFSLYLHQDTELFAGDDSAKKIMVFSKCLRSSHIPRYDSKIVLYSVVVFLFGWVFLYCFNSFI